MRKRLSDEELANKRAFIKELVTLTNEYLEEGHELERVIKLSNVEEPYSLRNSLLIKLQNPSATICAGFVEWKKQGRSVRKGETGAIVLVPLILKNDQEEEYLRFKSDYVFDISQTEEVEAQSWRVALESIARELLARSNLQLVSTRLLRQGGELYVQVC